MSTYEPGSRSSRPPSYPSRLDDADDVDYLRRDRRIARSLDCPRPVPKVKRALHPPAEERSRRSASGPLLGRLAEEVVHDHARRLVCCLSPRPEQSAYYWRGELGREVDVVMTIEGKPIPIEGRFRADPRRDLDGRRAFLESHSAAPFGLVVTRDLVELREGTLFLPLSCFLLMI